jgi:hypothetical protein
MRSIETYYGGLGWKGGPHLIIDDRVTWVLNPLTKPGTHTASWNNKSFGVTMIGNYNVEPLDTEVRDNTVQAVAILSAALKLKADSLRLHRDDSLTSSSDCPGKNVVRNDIIRLVEASISKLVASP